MIMSERRKIVREVVRLLEDPNERWIQGPHTINHPSGFSLWTGDWIMLLSIDEPAPISLWPWEKVRVWWAVLAARALISKRWLDDYRAKKEKERA